MTSVPFVSWSDVEYGALVEIAPGVRRIIADNPGKFTYTGTGTYVIGSGSVAVIDPGPDDQAHIQALLAGLDGESVDHILITHTHRDHSPGARALAEGTGAATYGFGPHPPEDSRDDNDEEEPGDFEFAPDHVVDHGDVIEGPGWRVEALHTPGHISNHLCFAFGAGVFTGDHVMGWSTTVIPPPDGDMAAYLASLELMFDRGDTVYWPTHGPPVTEPDAHVRALHAHRLAREAQILEELRDGPATIADMVRVLYADIDERLHEAAGRSMLAHLVKLMADGRVTAVGDRYRRAG